MIWSVSTAKMFEQCQRQWFYKTCLGNARAKDPLRQQAYRLGKLQSISAWRGSIVDHVLSQHVMPAIEFGDDITQQDAIALAISRFDRQLAIATAHPLRDPAFNPSGMGEDFVAFHALEYGPELTQDVIDLARAEVKLAIEKFFSMQKLIDRLQTADRLICQRSLTFNHDETPVRAVPDVIVFKANQPPAIIDWKVHVFGWRDAWLQLGVYAAALVRAKRHVDFPDQEVDFKETEIGLLEVQLLTGTLRRHSLSVEDLASVDAYISASVDSMLMAVDGVKGKIAEADPKDFPATRYANVCERCPYKSLCWETLQ